MPLINRHSGVQCLCFARSVFLAQFKVPDGGVLQVEDRALRAMVPGPYQWCTKNDLFSLKQYGQSRAFPSLAHMSTSARCRMVNFENLARGGLRLREKMAAVKEAMQFSSQCLGRQQLWSTWFRKGILNDMLSSLQEITSVGLSVASLKEKAAGSRDVEDAHAHSRNKRMKKNFQKTVRTELEKTVEVNSLSRMRFKLDRWNLPGFPGRTAERLIKALGQLKDHLPPRVSAAVLRTAWNGWCTDRKFQGHGPCRFGCGTFTQSDSLEHYAGCPVTVGFLRKRLQFHEPIDRGHLIVLSVHKGYPCLGALMRLALWGYVLYRTFNHLRHAIGQPPQPSIMHGIMEQYLREAINGHEGASKFVRCCWDPRYSPQNLQAEESLVGQDD